MQFCACGSTNRQPSPLTGPTWECRKHLEVGGKEEVTAESKIMCQGAEKREGLLASAFNLS